MALRDSTQKGSVDQLGSTLQARFTSGALVVVAEVVKHAWKGVPDFPTLTIELGKLSDVLDLWEAIPYAYFSFQSIEGVAMAPAISSYLIHMRIRITEELAWLNGSSLFLAISIGQASLLEADTTLLMVWGACSRFPLPRLSRHARHAWLLHRTSCMGPMNC